MITRGAPDYTNAEDSFIALELCEAAYRSAREWVEVTFPLEKFRTPAPVTWAPGEPYSGHSASDLFFVVDERSPILPEGGLDAGSAASSGN